MPNTRITMKSVFDTAKDNLCQAQDFGTASVVRDIQRIVDPNGTKRMNPNQARIIESFLRVLIKTA